MALAPAASRYRWARPTRTAFAPRALPGDAGQRVDGRGEMIKLPIAVVGNDHPAQSMVGAQSRLLGPHPVLGHDRPGAGDQAHWIAYTALKQKFEKRGDHWIAKDNPADCDGAGRSACCPRKQQRAADPAPACDRCAQPPRF